jgi:hypothetical protein
MSSTPSAFEPQFAVVGERVSSSSAARRGVATIVLHRSGRPLRAESIAPFADHGTDEVVVAIGPKPRYEIEQMVTSIPRLRFLIAKTPVTHGELVNLAMREIGSPIGLVIWSDMSPPQINDSIVEALRAHNAVCTVPVLRSERNEMLPSIQAPAFFRNLFRTVPMQPGVEGNRALFPFASVGFYDRERFESLGGFDKNMRNPYWQRMDFGMRAYLWGDRVDVMQSVRIHTTRPLPEDDATPDASYARFYLKNLAVKFVRDRGRLRWAQLPGFMVRSGLGLSQSVAEFARVRNWVEENQYRFVQDARRVTELWETS